MLYEVITNGDFCSRPGIDEISTKVLRAHCKVRTAVGLAKNHRDLRHGSGGISEQQLRAVADDTAAFLRQTGHEARHVDEVDDRDIERVAEADETRALVRRIDVEDTSSYNFV